MKFAAILLIFIFTITPDLKAQENYILITGKVKDAVSAEGIENANISIHKTRIGTSSDKHGNFSLKIDKIELPAKLYISHIGYKTYSKNIKTFDTIFINSELIPELKLLPELTVKSKSEPEVVFSSNKFNVSSFEFYERGIIACCYEKSIKKDNAVFYIENEKVLSDIVQSPVQVMKTFKDYYGNLNIIGEKKVFRLNLHKNNISFSEIQYEQFTERIIPCIDTMYNEIIFSDYKWYYPSVNFLSYNYVDSSYHKITNVSNNPLMKEYEFEYYFMSPREKLEARRAADKLGVDKTYLAALMTGFHKSIYYEPVYAPLFIIDDTLIVFDHYKNKLFKFNEFYEPADSISINYHFIQNDKKWIKQLIRDEATDKIYTVHEKSGYYYLSSLNLYSGESELIIKLSHPYPENIRIKNGHVYYIYRPFGSAQNKFLYRERL